METKEVVAAIIINSEHKIFITERGYGSFKGLFEFPGGKIEPHETREAALKREIREELDSEIEILDYLDTIEHDYDDFHLVMHCFICKLTSGSLTLIEAASASFIDVNELDVIPFLPADFKIIPDLKRYMKEHFNIPELEY